MNIKDIIVSVVAGLIGGFILISVYSTAFERQQDYFIGNSFSQCRTLTETLVTIGDEASTQVLSATSGRSWARIQLVVDSLDIATNTPSVAFGSSATLANGLQLSTSTPFLEFGMDTDHPYSGIVSVITDKGSTTLRVSECR